MKKITKKFVLIAICSIIFVFLAAPSAFASPISEAKLIELTNQERTMRGIKPLTIDPMLYFAAKNKANDMLERDYFEHFSPIGKSPWNFIIDSGYHYKYAGENLAMDFRTSEGIMNAWMNSAGHKANILDENFNDIGLATLTGDFAGHESTIVVQMFGKKDTSILGKTNFLVNKVASYLLGL